MSSDEIPSTIEAIPQGAACTPRARASTANPWLLIGGSVLSAVLASACCVGPLVLAVLGLGGAATLMKLSPLRPYLLPLTVGLLSTGLWLAYRKPRAPHTSSSGTASNADCGCALPRTRKVGRLALWLVAGAVLALLVAPDAIGALLG